MKIRESISSKSTRFEVKVCGFWVVVSDLGYTHFKGERRIIKA